MSEHPTRPTALPQDHRPDEPSPAPGAVPAPGPDVTPTRLEGPSSSAPRRTPPAGRVPTPQPPATGSRAPLETGTTIGGRYRLDSPLATGGMATVWRATDTVLTRPVAVKVLHADLAADPEFVARFRREAVAAARLAHPSIVAIYDTADEPEAIVMELVEGRTLRDELDTRGFLPPAEAVSIASSICLALEAAHRAGIVHRDVKPANVLLSRDGRLKVADFGIAKAARAEGDDDLPDLTSTGRMVGTAKYLAPEQVSGGDVDPRTDVYAVGTVLYEMLCGRPPFTGDNDLAVATARLHGPPPRPRSVLPTLPPRLDDIVMRALANDPDDRYPSASALWADLQSCPTGDVVMAPVRLSDTDRDSPASFARAERSWLVPAVLVSLVAVALGLAWLLIGGTEARRDFLDLVDRVAPGRTAPAAADPVEVEPVGAQAFDPQGTDGEHDDQAALAVDGDAATGWTTEHYDTSDFGGLKDGVGLIVDLGDRRRISEVRITSPNGGWSGAVYVSDSSPSTLAGWGDPAASIPPADAGTATIALADVRGSHVLVWLTDLGAGSGGQVELSEVTVVAR